MRAKQLIEKLEDLATFLTLARNDAGKAKEEMKEKERFNMSEHWGGREEAYRIAFNKVDGIIQEAKR